MAWVGPLASSAGQGFFIAGGDRATVSSTRMSAHQQKANPTRKPNQPSTPAGLAEREKTDSDPLAFPGRSVLYVREVAEKLRVTEQHVLDLIEEGKLRALNIGGGSRKFYRIPVPWYQEYLKRITE